MRWGKPRRGRAAACGSCVVGCRQFKPFSRLIQAGQPFWRLLCTSKAFSRGAALTFASILHVHMCVPISSTSRILCVRRSHAQVHNDVLCLLVFVQGYSFIISSSSSIFLAKVSFLRRKTNITHFFFCFFCEKRFILRMN